MRPSRPQKPAVRPSPGSAPGERVGYTDLERGRWLLEFGSRAMAAFTPDEVTSLQLELEWFLRHALSERRRDEKSVAAITQSTLLVKGVTQEPFELELETRHLIRSQGRHRPTQTREAN